MFNELDETVSEFAALATSNGLLTIVSATKFSLSGMQFDNISDNITYYTEEVALLTAAWRSGSERRFYDDHDRKVDGSPPNLVSLLRPWIRCFTMIISAWWNLASSKLKKSEENSSGKLGNKGNS